MGILSNFTHKLKQKERNEWLNFLNDRNPAHYYAYTILKDDSLSAKAIEERWNKLGAKQKKKHMTDLAKKKQEYVKEFENFVRV